MLTPQQIIEHLGLEPLRGEGGLFVQSYCSPETIGREHLPERYQGNKPFGTAIYYLLTAETNSFFGPAQIADGRDVPFLPGRSGRTAAITSGWDEQARHSRPGSSGRTENPAPCPARCLARLPPDPWRVFRPAGDDDGPRLYP